MLLIFSYTLLYLALVAHFVLVLIVAGKMFFRRKAALRSGQVTFKQIALHSDAWPDDALKCQRNFANQFETPVLFITGVLLTFIFGLTDLVFGALAVFYMISRYAHMFIHTGSNHVMTRAQVFGIGVFILLIFWLYLTFNLAIIYY